MRISKAHSITQRSKKSAAQGEKGWDLRQESGLEILRAGVFESVPWLVHGFSTRTGGASRLDRTAALNLGFTEWDSREAVMRNREHFAKAVWPSDGPSKSPAAGKRTPNLITLRQVHSDIIHVFKKPPWPLLKGDAAICVRAGVLVGIQTADCVPILLADPRRRVVAAVHAGWRGTLARVVAKTLGRLRLEFATRPEDIIAALGPAIGPCCYEVGPEVAQAFAGQFAGAADWFEGPFERLAAGEEPNPLPWLTMMPPGHEPPPERVQLDLRAANRRQLIDAGVVPTNIAVSSLCTGCRRDLFFSYRKEGAGTGRMLSVIGIRGDLR